MENEWEKRIQKPIGVYVWTFLVFIKFGLLNFTGYFFAFRNVDGDIYMPYVIISLALCVFTAGSAIWAFTGQNEGRIALLILVPLNILWLLLFAISAMVNNEIADDEPAVFSIIQQVILSVIVVGMEWYFMSEKVVQYYKQDG